jgi:hypothetical protein
VSSPTLAEFLAARLDEDGAAAKAWLPLGNPDAAQREHIACVDPGRVLREVEAKREILAAYECYLAERKEHAGDLALSGAFLALHGTVKTLAAVWRDHPDWRADLP